MTPPYVGPRARDDHRGLCCYGDELGDPLCLAEAKWHGIVADQHGGPVKALDCCDRHKPILQRLAQWIHAYDTPCALPDALFFPDENACRVPWDELESALQAETWVEVCG